MLTKEGRRLVGKDGRRTNGHRRMLPEGYDPSTFDVLCGKGKSPFKHAGNVRFRALVSENAFAYYGATSKDAKSAIVLSLVKHVRTMCLQEGSNGGFIRFDEMTCRWYEIGDAAAREKTGQTLREYFISNNPIRAQARRCQRKLARMSKAQHAAFVAQTIRMPNSTKPRIQENITSAPIKTKASFRIYANAKETFHPIHFEVGGTQDKDHPDSCFRNEPSDLLLINLESCAPPPALSYLTSSDWFSENEDFSDFSCGDFAPFKFFEGGLPKI